MNLSDKQLLLLDTFMYSDIVTKNSERSLREVLSKYKYENGKVDPSVFSAEECKGFSGEMDAEKMADVMNEMLADEDLCSLRIASTTLEYKGSIRGACFVDEKTNSATVAFRGTGGSFKQWFGNFEAFGEVTNESQDDAIKYINSLPYDNIEVTGHSNGANLAMVVTIVCGKKISECRSFEGEGFSKEFKAKYGKEIEINKRKITQISAHNDPVHVVLQRIAGIEKYVNGNKGKFSHGTYAILKNNTFDENGDFEEKCFQKEDEIWRDLGEKISLLTEFSDVPFVGTMLESFSDFLGIAFGFFMDFKDINSWLQAYSKLVESYNEKKINFRKDFVNLADSYFALMTKILTGCGYRINQPNMGECYVKENPYIQISTTDMQIYAFQLAQISERAKRLDQNMNSLYFQLGINWDTIANFGNLLKAGIVLDYTYRLDGCVRYLSETAQDFENVERSICI